MSRHQHTHSWESLMDCQAAHEKQEGRPGRPGDLTRARGVPTSSFTFPRSSGPSFWLDPQHDRSNQEVPACCLSTSARNYDCQHLPGPATARANNCAGASPMSKACSCSRKRHGDSCAEPAPGGNCDGGNRDACMLRRMLPSCHLDTGAETVLASPQIHAKPPACA